MSNPFVKNHARMTSLGAALLMAVAAGCKTGPPPPPKIVPYAVVVERTGTLADQPVEVDIIGADDRLKRTLIDPQGKLVDAAGYFTPNSQLRTDALTAGGKTMYFPAGERGTAPQVLGKDDPIWAQWKARKARYLIVIAGPNNPRAQDGPIDLKSYDKTARSKKTVDVRVYPTQIELPPLN